MKSKIQIDKNTLFLFPCSAEKESRGHNLNVYRESLSELITPDCYRNIIAVRKELLTTLRQDKRYISDKYLKNNEIKYGPDFGGADLSGQYLPAIERYKGTLYSCVPDFSEIIKECLNSDNCPHMLILSALYGPLYPLDIIQDYNLQMSDSPAYLEWKDCFPVFLRSYVLKNEIKNIHLYFGSSTRYFKIAKKEVISLLKETCLKKVIHLKVINGNLFHTPYNHGLLIIKHLKETTNLHFTCQINEEEVKD